MPAKKPAASVAYERFVRAVFEALVNQDTVKNIEVQHNVKLPGRAGRDNQIDVFWAFEVAGVRYRTVIECKMYKRNVSVGVVRSIVGLVADLGPGTTGIIVTTEGFQPAAIAWAKEHGIRLIKANPVLQEGRTGNEHRLHRGLRCRPDAEPGVCSPGPGGSRQGPVGVLHVGP